MTAYEPHEEHIPVQQKQPAALLWIIIGLMAALGCMILIERMIPRY